MWYLVFMYVRVYIILYKQKKKNSKFQINTFQTFYFHI
jgi:hypothetical protein